MAQRREHFAIWLANFLLIAALLVFAKGFFPHKPFLSGLATWPSDLTSASTSRPAPFDRVIFMVVDALRSDFVYGNSSGFTFTQSLIREGAAVPFTGHASPPTITMPRVKAITTGSVPSFVDLVLNFAESDTSSTLKDQDSWLAQLKVRGDKLVMYGDDTWLRLFPGFFERSDGTTSFFVSDFTEVDNNVTRHIPAELANDDWSAMTLHFLGLDHIGHKTGPKGPNMPAKQAEMDGIVEDIYTAMERHEHLQSCLLVLLGDHGMNEGGNHGASSPGEVSTALTFISPKLKSAFEGRPSPLTDAVDYKYYHVVQQSDIAPTLAALLGFPIPRNNLGIIVPHLLDLWTAEQDKYDLLYANAEQIHLIAKATFPAQFQKTMSNDCSDTTGDEAVVLACLWHKISRTRQTTPRPEQLDVALTDIRSFLYKAQSILSGTASNYDLSSMKIGIGLGTLALVLTIPAFLRLVLQAGLDGLILTFILLAYAITMFASSYVEEEHQFWYWILSAWLFLLYIKDNRYTTTSPPPSPTQPPISSSTTTTTILTTLLLLLPIRRWTQTGQKYSGSPSLLTTLITPHPGLLWPLVILTYTLPSLTLSSRAIKWTGTRQMGILPILVTASAFLFKIAFTAADSPELISSFPPLTPLVSFAHKYPLVKLAQIIFLGLGQILACAIYYEAPWQSARNLQAFMVVFQDILSVFLITQTRTVYVPLYLFFMLQLALLKKGPRRRRRSGSSVEVAVTGLLFQYASFFAFGGTNSIATVDLSNAYNGVSGYNVGVVGGLTFASNWAGPVWWAFGVCQLFGVGDLEWKKGEGAGDGNEKGNQGTSGWEAIMTTMGVFASVHTLSVMVACMVLREHLFIWTVFSPKYLYTAAWVVGQHVVVNMLGVGALLRWT